MVGIGAIVVVISLVLLYVLAIAPKDDTGEEVSPLENGGGEDNTDSTETENTDATDESSTTPTEETTVEAGYTVAIEESFLDECTPRAEGQGLTIDEATQFCQCTWASIEANVPYEEFVEADQTGVLTPEMEQMAQDCSALVTGDTATS